MSNTNILQSKYVNVQYPFPACSSNVPIRRSQWVPYEVQRTTDNGHQMADTKVQSVFPTFQVIANLSERRAPSHIHTYRWKVIIRKQCITNMRTPEILRDAVSATMVLRQCDSATAAPKRVSNVGSGGRMGGFWRIWRECANCDSSTGDVLSQLIIIIQPNIFILLLHRIQIQIQVQVHHTSKEKGKEEERAKQGK